MIFAFKSSLPSGLLEVFLKHNLECLSKVLKKFKVVSAIDSSLGQSRGKRTPVRHAEATSGLATDCKIVFEIPDNGNVSVEHNQTSVIASWTNPLESIGNRKAIFIKAVSVVDADNVPVGSKGQCLDWRVFVVCFVASYQKPVVVIFC